MFELTSSVFEDEGNIPDLYTCKGKNISPPLSFKNPPAQTKSYALVMEDLDTPLGIITHWVIYNIPADTIKLAAAVPRRRILEINVRQGRNGMYRFGYMGPCPPWGNHRYYFRLFALGAFIETDVVYNKKKLLREIEEYILDTATLMGHYARKKRLG